MQRRVGIEDLNTAIDIALIFAAQDKVQQQVKQLTKLSANWIAFSEEKLMLSSESLLFLLRQRQSIFLRGFPSSDNEYLALIERQMGELKRVYIAFYNLHPGLIHRLSSEQPEVYIWLMLQVEFSNETSNLLSALSLLDKVSVEMASMLTIQSRVQGLDVLLAKMIDGDCPLKAQYLVSLNHRQTLSVALCKHWLRKERLSPDLLNPILAMQQVEEATEWLNTQVTDAFLFECIMTKHDRGTWFRKQFGIEISDISSDEVVTFGKLLELSEFEPWNLSSKNADIDFVLGGNTNLVPSIVEQLLSIDEIEGERWIQALHAVYGPKLPILPSEVGVDKEWEEVVDILEEWVEDERHITPYPFRVGKALSFESTISAMRNPDVSALLRVWLWRHLCVHSRAFIPWAPMMSAHQQEWNFTKLASTPSAIERFNMRSQNAVVGY
ncbi:hypothetical protein ACPV5O_05155 [Vibrio maritimus]|uniref:hypothetical protein n=1 Tax=Vibrio maritimus TaxID=990268 RepID=UPI004067D230